MKQEYDFPELPLGLGMALAQNPEAMNRFASLNAAQKQAVISHTHYIASRKEMQAYVAKLAENQLNLY